MDISNKIEKGKWTKVFTENEHAVEKKVKYAI